MELVENKTTFTPYLRLCADPQQLCKCPFMYHLRVFSFCCGHRLRSSFQLRMS